MVTNKSSVDNQELQDTCGLESQLSIAQIIYSENKVSLRILAFVRFLKILFKFRQNQRKLTHNWTNWDLLSNWYALNYFYLAI